MEKKPKMKIDLTSTIRSLEVGEFFFIPMSRELTARTMCSRFKDRSFDVERGTTKVKVTRTK